MAKFISILFLLGTLLTSAVFAQTPLSKAVTVNPTNHALLFPFDFFGVNLPFVERNSPTNFIGYDSATTSVIFCVTNGGSGGSYTGVTSVTFSEGISNNAEITGNTNLHIIFNTNWSGSCSFTGVTTAIWEQGNSNNVYVDGTNLYIMFSTNGIVGPKGDTGAPGTGVTSVTWSEGPTNNAEVVGNTNLVIMFKIGGGTTTGAITVTWLEGITNNAYVTNGTNLFITFRTNYSASVGSISHTNLIEQDGDTNHQHIPLACKTYITNQTILAGESGIYFRVDGGTTWVGHAP